MGAWCCRQAQSRGTAGAHGGDGGDDGGGGGGDDDLSLSSSPVSILLSPPCVTCLSALCKTASIKQLLLDK